MFGHYTYLFLYLISLFFPFILSFDKKVFFYNIWKELFTGIFIVVALHPLLLPVIMYEVVAVGDAVTLAPVEEFKPADGDHEYVVAPLAVNTVLLPLQIEVAPLTLTTGNEFTNTKTV